MTRKLLLLFILILALTVPTLFTDSTQAQESPSVLVRFIHAFPADVPLDVYVDDALVARNLDHGETTPHLRFTQGQAQVEVRAAGSDALTVPFAERTVNLVTSSIGFGHVALVIQTDGFNQPAIARIDDLLSPTNIGQARVHLIHAAPDQGSVDLISAAGAPFLQGVAFNASTGTVDPPVGKYDFVVAPSGATDGTALATIEEARLRTGFLHTLVLMPGIDNEGFMLRMFDTPVMPSPDVETVLVQIGHGSSGAPDFDVYADGTLLLPDLRLGEVLPHIALPRGTTTLSLREADSPPTITPAVEQTVELQSSTGAMTLMALGTLEDGTFTFATYDDEIDALDPATASIRVINGTTNGPLNLQLGAESIANVLPIQEATDPISALSGVYDISGMVDDAEINGPLPVALQQQPIIGGAWVTILAYTTEEPMLSIATSAIETSAVSLPGYVLAVVPTPTPAATTPALALATQPGPFQPPPRPVDNVVTATVNLNQGVNLQCREYPTPLARSLGLIPNNTDLLVQGFAGPIDPENGELNTPLEPGAFSDIETVETFEEVWLQTDWTSVQDGQVRCWVRADFILLYYTSRGRQAYLSEPIQLFELALLDDPPIQRIPANFAGSVGGGEQLPPVVAPTATMAPDVEVLGRVSATTQLLDAINGTRIRDIPEGANIVVLGQDATGGWLNVRYEVLGEGVNSGWVPSSLVDITTPNPIIPIVQ